MKKKHIKISVVLFILFLMTLCNYWGDKNRVSNEEALKIVANDCSKWCKDNENLNIALEGYDEKDNLMIIVRRKSNKLLEAGYHIDPETLEITRKYILNSEYEAIENGVVESVLKMTDVTFNKVADSNLLDGTSSILNVASGLDEIAKYRGSLISLFGEPSQESTDSEQAFTYIIKAKSSDSSEWILTAYEGPSGFSIGGLPNVKGIHEVTYLLKQKLSAVPPSDFSKDLIYKDTQESFSYGCKGGHCYSK